MGLNKILVPLDLRSSATELLKLSEAMAVAMHAKLCFVHFVSETTTDFQNGCRSKQCGELEIKIAQLVNEVLLNSPIQFEIIVTNGAIESRLIDLVEAIDFDLLITPKPNRYAMLNLLDRLKVPVLFKSDKHDCSGSFILPVKTERELEAKFAFAKTFNLTQHSVNKMPANVHRSVPKQLLTLCKALQDEYPQLVVYPYVKVVGYKGFISNPFFLSVHSEYNIVLTHSEFKRLKLSEDFDQLFKQVNVFLFPDIK